MRDGLRLLEQRIVEDTAQIEVLRQATSIGITDLGREHFNQMSERDLTHYLEGLRREATCARSTNTTHAAVLGASASRADIVDLLRLSQARFGDQARQRYQALILCTVQAIADLPITLADTTTMSLQGV